AGLLDLLQRCEGQRLRGADCGAHRALAGAGPVVAVVALHHLIDAAVIVRHAKGTRQHAVGAADAARRERALGDPVGGLLDRVGGADARADGVLAVHADLRRGLHAVMLVEALEMDQRAAAVRVALLACLHAGPAADAARVVDEERQLTQSSPPACGSRRATGSSGRSTRCTRTAQILNSGMFETGSIARMVARLAARSSGQW